VNKKQRENGLIFAEDARPISKAGFAFDYFATVSWHGRPRSDSAAGCHSGFQAEFGSWIPAFAGMTIEKGNPGEKTLLNMEKKDDFDRFSAIPVVPGVPETLGQGCTSSSRPCGKVRA
jgi:hypothetical protein